MFSLFFADVTSSGEAVRLENRLRNLSSGLVGLRNCLSQEASSNMMMLPPTFIGSNFNQGISFCNLKKSLLKIQILVSETQKVESEK